MADVLGGRIEPGRVFDRVTSIDGVLDGYRAMNDREAIEVMINFSWPHITVFIADREVSRIVHDGDGAAGL
jgi:hypothetical protein